MKTVEIFWLVLLVYLLIPTDGQIVVVASSQMVHEQKGQATYYVVDAKQQMGNGHHFKPTTKKDNEKQRFACGINKF